MDRHLNQLILEYPYPNTLGRLIFDAASNYQTRKWANRKTGAVTYKMADISALELAAFLKENGHHQKSYLYIDDNGSFESQIVLLAAIKAGLTLVDARVHPPLVGQNFMDTKRLLTFENNSFNDGKSSIEYRQAVKQGERALFFNIPAVEETHNAYYSFNENAANGLQPCPVDHKTAVKQIYSSVTGNNLHPYLRVIYHWFNGFPAPDPLAETRVASQVFSLN